MRRFRVSLPFFGVSTHSRPKAAARDFAGGPLDCNVSTHSRPKAAAINTFRGKTPKACFNSQPPEGGCNHCGQFRRSPAAFQLTAARRRLHSLYIRHIASINVSTHSRPKAAAFELLRWWNGNDSFNSQPPEGGCLLAGALQKGERVSTHSRPKAAAASWYWSSWPTKRFNSQPPEGGCLKLCVPFVPSPGFNSQPPEGGCQRASASSPHLRRFQLTAARRRLRFAQHICAGPFVVSTHSRPKAAASFTGRAELASQRFNSQPPEGGCSLHQNPRKIS